MSKYLELFKDGFDSTVELKIKPENWPYVAYSPSEGVVFTVIPEENQSGYQMIDLGLPSGLKWADRNVGASSPEDAGLYFSWGNIDGHAVDENGNVVDEYSFIETTYASTAGSQFTGSELDVEHDAATANMSDGWRMPKSPEIKELINNTTQTVDTENGGMIFTSKTNGNSIFIPFAGLCVGGGYQNDGSGGYVWSSSILASPIVRSLHIHSDGDIYAGDIGDIRYHGLSVRGVHA